MSVPVLLALVIWAAAMVFLIGGTWYSLSRLRHKLPPCEVWPPVSVLKPLKGADAGLEENIASFFRLEYPTFELIFSVASGTDPAGDTVRTLMARHPKVNARLIIGDVEVSLNPKVNNLVRSYAEAAHDHIVISDSNTRVWPGYLKHIVSALRPGVGVVTACVAGVGPEGVGGNLEATYLNTFYARWMYLAGIFGKAFVVGKSMLFRRSMLDRFGGISEFGRYVNEDYVAGLAARHLGLIVAIMPEAIPQHIGEYPFQAFWSRHLRWGRIRKSQAPFAFYLEPLFGSVLSGLLGAAAFSSLLDFPVALFLALHFLVWMAADLLLMHELERTMKVRMVLAWLLREALSVPQWAHMASGKSIEWRGSRLRIRHGGLLHT